MKKLYRVRPILWEFIGSATVEGFTSSCGDWSVSRSRKSKLKEWSGWLVACSAAYWSKLDLSEKYDTAQEAMAAAERMRETCIAKKCRQFMVPELGLATDWNDGGGWRHVWTERHSGCRIIRLAMYQYEGFSPSGKSVGVFECLGDAMVYIESRLHRQAMKRLKKGG